MLINMRNAMMAGKRLPYDAEVEYLESTGTQWIDTGVKGNASASLVIECTFLQKQPSGMVGFIFGSRSATDERFGFAVIPGGNGGNYSFGYRSDHNYNIALSSTFETVRFVATPTIAECTFRGTTLTASDAPLDTNLNIYIFTRNFSGSTGQNFEGCLASLKIYSNGVLVRDFIPVRKGTVGYLYDHVSGRLFGNEGTGDFVLGPDVVPVEYIESHGTEWIDTGYVPTHDSTFMLRFSPNNVDFVAHAIHGNAHAVQGYDSSTQSPLTLWTGNGYNNRFFYSPLSMSGMTVGGIYDIEQRKTGIVRNGTTVGTYNQSQIRDAPNEPMWLFNFMNGGSNAFGLLKLYFWKAGESGVLKRSLRPVRVGSGSTWEGAMMDVLTRRIYRNAGTGAFTYGNDLKYPIPAE